MFGYGIGQIFLGILSDSLGRKKILFISGLFYFIASFLSVISANIFILNVYRFLQGLSIAGLAVVCRAMAVDCFSGKDLIKATTYIGISWALGPIIGPFVGGYLQHYFNWQASFLVFSFYGLFIFVYTILAVPETNFNLSRFCFSQIYKNIKIIIIDPIFLCYILIASFCYALIVVFNVIGPFLVQIILKYSAVEYGYVALLLGASYFSGTLFNRFIIGYFKSLQILLFSITAVLLISIFMLYLSLVAKINLHIILYPIMSMFFLFGFIVPNTLANCMAIFPKIAGTASSIFGSLSGIIIFLINIFVSILKTDSQIPMAILYSSLLFAL